jgi:anti-anti-sigma regulatory factor
MVGTAGNDVLPFIVRLGLTGDRLELSGELDQRTVHLFDDAVSVLLLSDHLCWALDVTTLTKWDRAGLSEFGAAIARAQQHGRQLTLVGAPPALQAGLVHLRTPAALFATVEEPPVVPEPLPA